MNIIHTPTRDLHTEVIDATPEDMPKVRREVIASGGKVISSVFTHQGYRLMVARPAA